MKRVGRPPELDPETGETMVKSLVNVTIPTKLAEFLKRNNVNRSKLFTKVVTQMYNEELCPKCYTIDVSNVPMGIRCNGFCSRINPHFVKYHKCDRCQTPFEPKYNNPIYIDDETTIGEKCCHAKD